jgi:hypothetical protein
LTDVGYLLNKRRTDDVSDVYAVEAKVSGILKYERLQRCKETY